MSHRLEMVVAGKRQTAWPVAPDFTSRTAPSDGFFIEQTRLSPFEMPDHWIPFYGVGLQFVRGIGKRFFFQDGRNLALPFQNKDSLVLAPQEIRRYRLESESKLLLVSIEPVVLQEMVSGFAGP
jgi:hypothetical protein